MSNTKIITLERTVNSPQSVMSKYQIGKSIVTVKGIYSSDKRFSDAMYQIIRNKLEK